MIFITYTTYHLIIIYNILYLNIFFSIILSFYLLEKIKILIIFGQGLNKSHPYIFPIFQSIQDNDQKMFNENFNSLVKEIICNYSSLLNPLHPWRFKMRQINIKK